MQESNDKIQHLVDDLIESHKDKEEIKRIQRLAYRAKSKLHKEGVGMLILLIGPFGGPLFDVRDEHRDHDGCNCDLALRQLLSGWEMNEKNRIIAIHLLNTHPGRVNPGVITRWLDGEPIDL